MPSGLIASISPGLHWYGGRLRHGLRNANRDLWEPAH